MTRDDARNLWIEAQLDYSQLNLGRLQKLRTMLNDEMKDSGLISPSGRGVGTYRANAAIKAGISIKGWMAELTCRSYYFNKREAVTFNDSGFIGFAGWADDTNVQPILIAFAKWVDWMKAECFRHDDLTAVPHAG